MGSMYTFYLNVSYAFVSVSKRRHCALKQTKRSAQGFTLIELVVVLFILAVASAVAVMSLRSSDSQLLLQSAEQLAAVLDSARASARAQSSAVIWTCDPSGITLRGAGSDASQSKHINWQSARASCNPEQGVLGADPLIRAQSIWVYQAPVQSTVTALGNSATGAEQLDANTTPRELSDSVQIFSDGLGPFKRAVQ